MTSPSSLSFAVIGLPAPQGSKRHVGKGVMVESSKAVKPWREAVKQAAREAMAKAGVSAPALPGAVRLVIEFYLPRPKKYAKRFNARPKSRPDSSKLLRSTEDAMTEAGIWVDDSYIVDHFISKWYVGVVTLGVGMDVPGAHITVEAVYG